MRTPTLAILGLLLLAACKTPTEPTKESVVAVWYEFPTPNVYNQNTVELEYVEGHPPTQIQVTVNGQVVTIRLKQVPRVLKDERGVEPIRDANERGQQ